MADMENETKLSDSLAILKRRRLTLAIMGHGTSPSLKDDVQGIVPVLDFSLTNTAAITWAFEADISRDVDTTLTMLFATEGSEASKKVSFDIGIISLDSVANTDISVLTGTVQLVDLDIPATTSEVFGGSIVIPAATFYAGSNIIGLSIEFKRVASSADPTADVGLFSTVVDYEIG